MCVYVSGVFVRVGCVCTCGVCVEIRVVDEKYEGGKWVFGVCVG